MAQPVTHLYLLKRPWDRQYYRTFTSPVQIDYQNSRWPLHPSCPKQLSYLSYINPHHRHYKPLYKPKLLCCQRALILSPWLSADQKQSCDISIYTTVAIQRCSVCSFNIVEGHTWRAHFSLFLPKTTRSSVRPKRNFNVFKVSCWALGTSAEYLELFTKTCYKMFYTQNMRLMQATCTLLDTNIQVGPVSYIHTVDYT